MTNPFLFIFLVLGATIFSQCQPITPDEKENICEVIDPFIDITATTPLLINNTQSFSQVFPFH